MPAQPCCTVRSRDTCCILLWACLSLQVHRGPRRYDKSSLEAPQASLRSSAFPCHLQAETSAKQNAIPKRRQSACWSTREPHSCFMWTRDCGPNDGMDADEYLSSAWKQGIGMCQNRPGSCTVHCSTQCNGTLLRLYTVLLRHIVTTKASSLVNLGTNICAPDIAQHWWPLHPKGRYVVFVLGQR